MPVPDPLLVACLCAQWCTACQAYATVFDQVARQHPVHRFAWIDIEDHSDALGEAALDIENFPTLLVLGHPAQPAAPVRFYGTVLPHAATLARLLDAAAQDTLAPGQPCPPALASAVATLARRMA